MAVKTNISPQEFSAILSNYALGEYKKSEPVQSGSVQTNYFLWTTEGKFVVRRYENRSKESVLFEAHVIDYLKVRHYPCPALYRNRYGEAVGIFRDKPYVLFEFVEGAPIENPTKDQVRQLVQKVAELHNLTENYRPPFLKYRWNYSPELCRKLAQDAAARENTENARGKLAWFEAELQNLLLPESLPRGICHCDFHFSNVLFKDGVFKALIDFDDANYTYLIFDLAALLEPFRASLYWDTWSNFSPDEDVFDFHFGNWLVTEYQKRRPLSSEEKWYLFDVYKLSVLFDALWYFDRGEAGDFYEKRKLDYLNRLGREGFYHRLFTG